MKKIKEWILFSAMLCLLLPFFANSLQAVSVKGKVLGNVPNLKQFPELPTGCEITSMTMLSQFHGLEYSKMEMASFLPKGQKPYLKNGSYIGADPRVVFVGNPEDTSSFGVYHQPVMQVLENLFPFRVKNLSGSSVKELLEYVEDGLPVLVWTTFPTRDGKLILTKDSRFWQLEDGTTFEWIRNEHAMVLIGFTTGYKHVILNDPYTGKQQQYPLEMFEKSYDILGKQALVVTASRSVDETGGGVPSGKTGKDKLQTHKGKGEPALFSDAKIVFQGKKQSVQKYKIGKEIYVKVSDYAKVLAGEENQFRPVYKEKALYVYLGKRIKKETAASKRVPEKIIREDKVNKIALLVDADFYANNKKTTHPIYRIDGEDYLSLEAISKILGIKVISKENGRMLELFSMF